MKVLLTLLLLFVSLSVSAIGHPHNLFAAHRKAVRLQKKTAFCQETGSVRVVAKQTLRG